MKKFQAIAYMFILAVMILTACTLGFTPPPATQLPASTEAPAGENTATPTLVTIDLSGPPMEVGSTYPYFDGTILAAVPAGEFVMGRSGSDNPEHKVSLSSFWIYSTKVTNQQYARCVAVGLCAAPDTQDNQGYTTHSRLNDPVTGVNYDQAAAYCKFVNGRLPTEAEWEKAARGPSGNIYPWGDAAPSCDLLNFNNCFGKTTDVTNYKDGRSFYGALDMSGNTFEWVADWYDPFYYKNGPTQDPIGPDTGNKRSIRSSGYKSSSEQVALTVRFYAKPGEHRRDLGFRCVVIDPTFYAPFCEVTAQYGSGDVKVSCPSLNINVLPQKCDSGKTTVTFDSNDPSAVFTGVDSCASNSGGPGSFPAQYTCTEKGSVTLDGVCTYTGFGDATCPDHYKLDPAKGICRWDNSGSIGSACPVGYAYDPALKCCTITSSAGADFPLCEVGSTLVEIAPGKYGCLDNSVSKPNPHLVEAVPLPDACPKGGDRCSLTDASCKRSCRSGGTVDTSTCSCICNQVP